MCVTTKDGKYKSYGISKPDNKDNISKPDNKVMSADRGIQRNLRTFSGVKFALK